MKRWICALMALVSVICLTVSTAADEYTAPTAAQLLGAWALKTPNPEGMEQLEFHADGTMTSMIGGSPRPGISFCTRGGLLVVSMGDQLMPVPVALKGEDTLEFYGDEYRRTQTGADKLSLNNSLLGSWRSADNDGLSWTFNRDGSAQQTMNGAPVLDTVYMVAGTMLVYAESDNVYHTYDYQLNADGTLVLKEDGDEKLRFVRTGAPEPAFPIAELDDGALTGSWRSKDGGEMRITLGADGIMEAWMNDVEQGQFPYCVRDGFHAVLIEGQPIVSEFTMDGPDKLVFMNSTFERTAPGDGATTLENELLGNWVGRDDMGAIEFRADGAAMMQGMDISYAARDGMLIMLADGGMVGMAQYQLDASGALTLDFPEQSIVFDRAETN